jgi:hypothetical protein
MMNNTFNTVTQKRGRGRPKKINPEIGFETTTKTVGLPAMIEPTEHDIRDELSMLDSYNYFRNNNE